jgi:superfamily I DNA/RNA helicase
MVVGQAGYGKTRWLMDRVSADAGAVLQSKHQRLLALSVMHGARRRVDGALAERCGSVPRSVTTLDGFALGLVNRWRRGLGVERPFALEADGDESLFGHGATFDETMARAKELLESRTVKTYIANTYPIAIIDEFQDCHGRKLEFVQSLASITRLIAAADDFQLLDGNIDGCPAVEWVRSLAERGLAEIAELDTPRRTSRLHLLNATRAVRSNEPVQGLSVPFIACPKEGPAAFRILQRLALANPDARWTGTCAVLSPSHDPWTTRVLKSIDNQAARRRLHAFHWNQESGEDEACDELLRALGVHEPSERSLLWAPEARNGHLATQVCRRVEEVCKAHSVETITRGAVAYVARGIVHQFRSRGANSGRRVVTTVHGAKNREFDHVFLLWPFRLPPSIETQRRLLYNGLSRARLNAMVLMLGDESRAASDPVLSLLGTPEPAFQGSRSRARAPAARRR